MIKEGIVFYLNGVLHMKHKLKNCTFFSYIEQIESLPFICKEIRKCLDNNLIIAALTLSLPIPEILGNIEFMDICISKKGVSKR